MTQLFPSLLVSCILECVSCATVGQYFLVEPSDVIFQSGDDLQLPCTVGNKQGACQWTKDGFGLGIDPALPGFPRFYMGREGGDLGRGDLGRGDLGRRGRGRDRHRSDRGHCSHRSPFSQTMAAAL